jgi:membrane-bound serine protease (ClpP class)
LTKGANTMNLAGVLLVALAVGLFIIEAFTSGYALFAAAGLLSLILGLILLFDFAVSAWVTGTLFILILALSLIASALIWRRVIQSQRQKVATGHEELIGKVAKVRAALNPEGTVFIYGEIWSASMVDGHAEVGEEVTVIGVNGLKLCVAKNMEGANKCPKPQ